MNTDTWAERFSEVLSSEDWEGVQEGVRHASADIGAGLLKPNLKVIRSIQKHLNATYRLQFSKFAKGKASADAREAFCCGFLYASYHLCDGFAANLAPQVERRALLLKASQRDILEMLSTLGPTTTTGLASHLSVDKSAISRALGGLERDRLVAVISGPEASTDGRKKLYELTARGRGLIGSFQQATGTRSATETDPATAKVNASVPPATAPAVGSEPGLGSNRSQAANTVSDSESLQTLLEQIISLSKKLESLKTTESAKPLLQTRVYQVGGISTRKLKERRSLRKKAARYK